MLRPQAFPFDKYHIGVALERDMDVVELSACGLGIDNNKVRRLIDIDVQLDKLIKCGFFLTRL
jgi:hypothetical protein